MISFGAATSIYLRLTWRRLRRGRFPFVIIAVALLPLLGEAGLALSGSWGRGLFDDMMEIYFRFLVPFAPALLLAPHIAEEVDHKTVTFLFSRPAPRGALVLGKLIAVALPLAIATILSLPIVFFVAMARFPNDIADNLPHLGRTELTAVVGLFAFATLAQAFGARFLKHPVVGVLTVLIAESGIASLPIAFNLIAPTWHLRNLAELPLPTTYLTSTTVSPWLSLLILLALGTVALLFTLVRVRDAEYAAES